MKIKIPEPNDLKDYNEVIKKHKAEKKLRKQILRLDEDEVQLKLLRDYSETQVKQHELQMKAQASKQKHLQEMIEKSKARQEDIQKTKVMLESPVRTKPKYLEIEESYKFKVEIPELERRKMELAKKRNMHKPLSRLEWLEHLKKYNEVVAEAERRRSKKLQENQLGSLNIINTAKREMEIELENIKKYKKNMMNKMKRYAEVVQDIFIPKTSIKPPGSKHKPSRSVAETKSYNINAKLMNKSFNDQNANTDRSLENFQEANNLKRVTLIGPDSKPSGYPSIKNPLKPIKNPSKVVSASKTPDIKQHYVFDYLASKRQANKSSVSIVSVSPIQLTSSYSPGASKQSLLTKLQKQEKDLLSNQYKLRNSDPNSLKLLEFEESLNQFLANSIKAKLSLL